MIVLSRSGAEYTNDMNIPLESKYWNLENDLKNENDHPDKTDQKETVFRSRGWKNLILPPVHGSYLVHIFRTVHHRN